MCILLEYVVIILATDTYNFNAQLNLSFNFSEDLQLNDSSNNYFSLWFTKVYHEKKNGRWKNE